MNNLNAHKRYVQKIVIVTSFFFLYGREEVCNVMVLKTIRGLSEIRYTVLKLDVGYPISV